MLLVVVALDLRGCPIRDSTDLTRLNEALPHFTVNVVDPQTVPAQALIVTDPGATANTVPKLLVSLLMVATELRS